MCRLYQNQNHDHSSVRAWVISKEIIDTDFDTVGEIPLFDRWAYLLNGSIDSFWGVFSSEKYEFFSLYATWKSREFLFFLDHLDHGSFDDHDGVDILSKRLGFDPVEEALSLSDKYISDSCNLSLSWNQGIVYRVACRDLLTEGIAVVYTHPSKSIETLSHIETTYDKRIRYFSWSIVQIPRSTLDRTQKSFVAEIFDRVARCKFVEDLLDHRYLDIRFAVDIELFSYFCYLIDSLHNL